MEWQPSKIRIARVNRRAAGQRQMRERGVAVILQWTEKRIGIDMRFSPSRRDAREPLQVIPGGYSAFPVRRKIFPLGQSLNTSHRVQSGLRA